MDFDVFCPQMIQFFEDIWTSLLIQIGGAWNHIVSYTMRYHRPRTIRILNRCSDDFSIVKYMTFQRGVYHCQTAIGYDRPDMSHPYLRARYIDRVGAS